MRPQLDAKTLAGSLAVLGAILLTSPGVRVVRADSEQAAGEAPVCQVTESQTPEAQALQLEAAIALARAEMIAGQQPLESNPNRPILLNNRGFNYGEQPRVDPISAELKSLGLD